MLVQRGLSHCCIWTEIHIHRICCINFGHTYIPGHNHDEIQNVPSVPEVRITVQEKSEGYDF